ncbi:alpha/beta hydrolase family protein [Nocardioides sp. CPCC 205120]|uniref:alpha/beta hydrolase family protein n=1 Tax=Nocardioides sp. CPCC 205120 TaxID=3406462 RepID=UPI003B508C9E
MAALPLPAALDRPLGSGGRRRALVAGVAASLVLTGCSGAATSEPEASAPPAPTTSTAAAAAAPAPAVSVLGLAEQTHRGDQLRLGAVRERTAWSTSYDVTYRSSSTTGDGGVESYTISGVLDVPRGDGPFPAVVLAHGYIDPDVYVSGQGMTRERTHLASRGYVALHVDYRSHAGSDDDPDHRRELLLGYSADVVNAVRALQATDEVPVADDRIALLGRSMGGGVVLKSLVAEPGLVRAAALWASVSSLEAENFEQFRGDASADDAEVAELARRGALPGDDPAWWEQNSSRPYLDRITEPVLVVHGRRDESCPPRWADATQDALVAAGVDSRLRWYDDAHAFGPSFGAAMDDTVAFLREQGV